jgi:hypothetical protein
MNVFLDDERSPIQVISWMKRRVGATVRLYTEDDWYIVRDYNEFVDYVSKNINSIDVVSFDYDLADMHYDPKTWSQSFVYKEKTGHDCAKWMKEHYESLFKPLPKILIHSMNPVGSENIRNVFS